MHKYDDKLRLHPIVLSSGSKLCSAAYMEIKPELDKLVFILLYILQVISGIPGDTMIKVDPKKGTIFN